MGKDRGWDYLNSSSDDFDYDRDNDGSWGYENDDGSGSFYGNDGSWGYKNSDGSASYYGADGSWGYKNSDGSGSYYGNDGSWGYTNPGGGGSYYGSDGESEYFDSGDDGDSESGSGGSLLGALVGLGVAAFAISKLAKSSGDYSYDDEDGDNDEEGDDDEEDDSYYNSEEYQKLMQERVRQKAEEQRNAEEARRIKKEQRKEKRRRAWGVLTGKKFEAGISSLGCKGMMLEDVVRHFERQGFYKINSSAVEDLPFDRISEEGTVEGIVINNIDSFETVTTFPINAKIGIMFHKLQRTEPPLTSRSAKKKQISDVVEMFQEAGFVNVEQTIIRDLSTGWIVKDGSVEGISINGRSDFKRGEKVRIDAHIVVSYHTYKNRKER